MGTELGVYILGGGVGRTEDGGEAKKSAVNERGEICFAEDGRVFVGGAGVGLKGDAKKA